MPLDIQALSTLNRVRLRNMAKKINRIIVGPRARKFIQSNFKAGGQPKFAPNAPLTLWMKKQEGLGPKPLIATGQLFRKAIENPVIRATENTVIIRPRRPTARLKASMGILHFGGKISVPVTDKMRKFFWAMHFTAEEGGDETIADAWRSLALTRKSSLTINIPARPWTKLTQNQIRSLRRIANQAWSVVINNFSRTGRVVFPLTLGRRG